MNTYSSLSDKLLKAKREEKFFVTVVPVTEDGEVLLGRRVEDGIWTTPGGGAEPGEEPHEAARRELFEEAGLAAEPNALELVEIKETPRGYKIHVFLWRMPKRLGEIATSKLDPDQEVNSWKLLRPEAFPASIKSEENKSRLDTIRSVLMKYYGVSKAMSKQEELKILGAWMTDPETQMETIEDLTEERMAALAEKLDKGGPGSGIRGHVTNHRQYNKNDYAHLKGKGYSDAEIKAIWDRDHKDQKKPVAGKVKAPDVTGHAHGDQQTESQKMRDRRRGIYQKEDTRTEAQRMADTRRGGPEFSREWGKSEQEVLSLINKLTKAGPFEESKHPRAQDGKFGQGAGSHKVSVKQPSASHPHVDAPPAKPINKIQAHLASLNEGGVMPGLQTASGKPVANTMEIARAHGYTPQDHVDAMNAHYELAQKTQAMLEKFKMAGHKVPPEGAKIAQFHEKKMKEHMKARQYLEERAKNTEAAIKEQKAKATEHAKKSITQMGGGLGDRDLDIGSFAQANGQGHTDWMEKLYAGMEGYSYGEDPKEFECPAGKLTLAKVDDGLYTGFFTRKDELLLDNARVRLERLTIPELVQLMIAKEWIPNHKISEVKSEEPTKAVVPEQPVPEAASQLNEIIDSEPKIEAPTVISNLTDRIRILELLAKLTS